MLRSAVHRAVLVQLLCLSCAGMPGAVSFQGTCCYLQHLHVGSRRQAICWIEALGFDDRLHAD